MGYAARHKIGRRWIEEAVPADMKAAMEKAGVKDPKQFHSGDLRVIVSIDYGWVHLSISHPYRYPTWDEIADAKRRFFNPEIEAVIVLPAEENYVNLHPNCFHVWESRCQQEGR